MKEINFDHVSEIDWARLAAYIDGEGCIAIIDSGYERSQFKFRDVRLSVSQADWRLMYWLKNNFGGYIAKTNSTNRQCWSWHCGGRRVTEILTRIRPYSITKAEQVDIALAYRATMTPGRKAIPQATVALRAQLKEQIQHVKRNPPGQDPELVQ